MDFTRITFPEFSHLVAVCNKWGVVDIEELKTSYPLAIQYIGHLTQDLVNDILEHTDEKVAMLKSPFCPLSADKQNDGHFSLKGKNTKNG